LFASWKSLSLIVAIPGFRSYFETWIPEQPDQDTVDVDALRERFVKKIYDDRFTEALPIVYKAYKKYKSEAAGQLGDELAEWADEVTESTWAKPNNSEKIQALRELLKSPVPCGIDGIDAQAKIEPIIGDDDLNDAINNLADGQGPDADVRPLIKSWLVQNMPGLLDQIQFGEKNSDDAQTNWAPQTSPQQAGGDEYGDQPDHPNVSNMAYEDSDPLDFIRNLAGLKK
jgi:hypothetical protein